MPRRIRPANRSDWSGGRWISVPLPLAAFNRRPTGQTARLKCTSGCCHVWRERAVTNGYQMSKCWPGERAWQLTLRSAEQRGWLVPSAKEVIFSPVSVCLLAGLLIITS